MKQPLPVESELIYSLVDELWTVDDLYRFSDKVAGMKDLSRYIRLHPQQFPLPYTTVGRGRVWLASQLQAYGHIGPEDEFRYHVNDLLDLNLRLGSYEELAKFQGLTVWGVKQMVYQNRFPKPHLTVSRKPAWIFIEGVPITRKDEATK